MIVSNIAGAKVSDFDKLINENIVAQGHLHKKMKSNMDSRRQKKLEQEADNKIVRIDSNSYQYSAPSRKLRYRKELVEFRPSMKKQMKRTANELKQAQEGF